MNLRSVALSVATGLSLAAAGGPIAAQSADLYCLGVGSVGWKHGKVAMREGGVNEFWLSTETGRWTERHVGGRAGLTDGGRYEIRGDGTGYRMDWVGVVALTNEMLRIDMTTSPMGFMRARRDQSVEVGTCVDTAGRRFLDGEEMTD